MKFIYIIILNLWVGFLIGQDVKYFVIDEELSIENQDTFLLFDVYAMSDVGFKLGAGQLYFEYDTLVFGQNIVENNKIEIIVDSTCVLGMNTQNSSSFYSQFIANDNTYSRFSFNWQAIFSDPCLSELNIKLYLAKLFQVKIQMVNSTESNINSLVCFHSEGDFDDLTFSTCGPDICEIQDCISYPGLNITQDSYFCEDCRIVTTTDDYNLGSLRFAIQCTPPGDTVYFDLTIDGKEIEIESESIIINKDLFIYTEDIDRNISISNKEMSNNIPIFIIYGDVIFEGLNIEGKTSDSMIIKLSEGGVEFRESNLEKIDIINN